MPSTVPRTGASPCSDLATQTEAIAYALCISFLCTYDACLTLMLVYTYRLENMLSNLFVSVNLWMIFSLILDQVGNLPTTSI